MIRLALKFRTVRLEFRRPASGDVLRRPIIRFPFTRDKAVTAAPRLLSEFEGPLGIGGGIARSPASVVVAVA